MAYGAESSENRKLAVIYITVWFPQPFCLTSPLTFAILTWQEHSRELIAIFKAAVSLDFLSLFSLSLQGTSC